MPRQISTFMPMQLVREAGSPKKLVESNSAKLDHTSTYGPYSANLKACIVSENECHIQIKALI